MSPPAPPRGASGADGVFFDANVWLHAALGRAAREGRGPAVGMERRNLAAEDQAQRLLERVVAGREVTPHTSEWVVGCVRRTLLWQFDWSVEAAEAEAEAVRRSVTACGGAIVAELADADLTRPYGVSHDDAQVLTAASLSDSACLVTADLGFLRAAASDAVREGRLYRLQGPRLILGMHPVHFEQEALPRIEAAARRRGLRRDPPQLSADEVREPAPSYGPAKDAELERRRQLETERAEAARREREREGWSMGPWT